MINILPAESNDQLYQGLDATDLVGTNEDNDQPGILTSTGNLRVCESFGEDQLKIRLNSRPNEAVRIQLNSSAPDEFSVLPEQLIFTPEDWNLEQSVTVRGLPDEVAEASSTYQCWSLLRRAKKTTKDWTLLRSLLLLKTKPQSYHQR